MYVISTKITLNCISECMPHLEDTLEEAESNNCRADCATGELTVQPAISLLRTSKKCSRLSEFHRCFSFFFFFRRDVLKEEFRKDQAISQIVFFLN